MDLSNLLVEMRLPYSIDVLAKIRLECFRAKHFNVNQSQQVQVNIENEFILSGIYRFLI